jgi:hypothetical protein
MYYFLTPTLEGNRIALLDILPARKTDRVGELIGLRC